MPAIHTVSIQSLLPDIRVVKRNGVEEIVTIVSRKKTDAYIHYIYKDKRLDEWVPEDSLQQPTDAQRIEAESVILGPVGNKRKRDSDSILEAIQEAEEGVIKMSEKAYDLEQHAKARATRNIDYVIFAGFRIKTWYFSPYPLNEDLDEAVLSTTITNTNRAHGRTADHFAGATGSVDTLWVCEFCFKYMTDPGLWESHTRKCTTTCPPGTKVYQRGAHMIWEVDGAKAKLYCQNLSLFGKLFIDIKTLFFDCDNFLFYLVTVASPRIDHVYGFFSKEKASYDDYNLGCIVIFPPFQKQGFGMLLIEFSYELSRRAGKLGTPERPLSDLGLRSYLAYWAAVIIRYLRRLLSVISPEEQERQRHIYLSNGDARTPDPGDQASPSEYSPQSKRRRTKSINGDIVYAPLDDTPDELFAHRQIVSTAQPDGSAISHVVLRCTLEDLAQATNLRTDDVAFTLNEIGLLIASKDEEEDGMELTITRELVEKVAKERKVKPPCMERQYVILPPELNTPVL